MTRLNLFGASIACATAIGCADATGPDGFRSEGTHWAGRIDPGQRVEVFGVNGSITATGTSGTEVVMDATRRGGDDPPTSVRIEIIEHVGGVTICAVYPDVPGRQSNECRVGGAVVNVNDNDVQVDFEIQVPAGVELVARTVNGSVTATEMQSMVSATTVNGDVRVSTSETAEAVTVNGSIDVVAESPEWSHDCMFATVNGSVTLRIPGNTNAEVEAVVVNGSIQSDFPLSGSNPDIQSGILGSGGGQLTLATVNGSISLRQL